MVTWAFVLETLIKWGIPVLAAAIIGVIVKYLVDPVKRRHNEGYQMEKQTEWDEYARQSTVMNEKCQVQIRTMETAIDGKFQEAKSSSKATDMEILAAIKDIRNDINQMNTRINSMNTNMENSLSLLQKGVLDQHFTNLVSTCKVYLQRQPTAYITPVELIQYNEKLALYHQLGGNGHMDVWDEKIRELPVREHHEM